MKKQEKKPAAKAKEPKGYKFSPEVRTAILQALRAGNIIEHAANYAGIHKDTFFEWAKLGRKNPESEYGKFIQECDIAIGFSAVRDMKVIDDAAQDGTWTAAAWKLERRFPELFGTRTKLEHSGPEGGYIPLVLSSTIASPDNSAKAPLLPEPDSGSYGPV